MIFPTNEEMKVYRDEVVAAACILNEKMLQKTPLVNSDYTAFEKHLFEFLSRILLGNSLYEKCGILVYSISFLQKYVAFFTQYGNITDKEKLIGFLQGVTLIENGV